MKQNLGIVRDYEINQVYSMWVQPHERCFSSWTSWRRIAWRHCTRLVLSCMSFVITPYLNFFLVKVDLSQESTINSSSSKKNTLILHKISSSGGMWEQAENNVKQTVWSGICASLQRASHCIREVKITMVLFSAAWEVGILLEWTISSK